MKKYLLLLTIFVSFNLSAAGNPQQLLQLIDYIGVDYPEAVRNGQVINPEEFEEMRDFANGISAGTGQLPTGDATQLLQTQATNLQQAIEQHQPATIISGIVAAMRTLLIENYQVVTVPRSRPDISRARSLFSEQCAGCHGLEGYGNGMAAMGMEPAPTNFRDPQRHAQRSVYGLYNTITLGVKGTAMPGFNQLSDAERWSLAFYVGQMGAAAQLKQQAAAYWQKEGSRSPLLSLQQVTTLSPAEAQARQGQTGLVTLTHLRSHPEILFSAKASPLEIAVKELGRSLESLRRGDRNAAYQDAVSAYLEGFELAEPALKAINPELLLTIEKAMTNYRSQIKSDMAVETLAGQVEELVVLIEQAQSQLNAGSLSGAGAFSSSFIILLREGLEAILVVAALAAFLIKTGRQDAMPYLHAGWIGALALGFVTWLVSTYVIEIGGAGRELTEGIAAITAAGILFYVGFWLHNKTRAAQWKRFIEGSIHKALSAPTLWSLAGLSFISVYREVFETILFYQAIWLQTSMAGQSMVISGFVVGAVILAVLAWLILRYSTRLPLRQFFAATGILMFVMAVVFTGKGIAALQEAGKLPLYPLDLPSIDLLGLYPNALGLGIQLLLVVAALLLVLHDHSTTPAGQ